MLEQRHAASKFAYLELSSSRSCPSRRVPPVFVQVVYPRTLYNDNKGNLYGLVLSELAIDEVVLDIYIFLTETVTWIEYLCRRCLIAEEIDGKNDLRADILNRLRASTMYVALPIETYTCRPYTYFEWTV